MSSIHSDNDPGDIMVMKNFNLKKREERQAMKQKETMRKLTASNLDTSNDSNILGLGIARRPSDNLLLKFNQALTTRSRSNGTHSTNIENTEVVYEDGPLNPVDLSDLPPPNKNFVTKNQRPISNDSISTKTSELFSSPSFDLHSRDSSIGNDSEDNETSMVDKSSILSEENTTLIIHQEENTQQNTNDDFSTNDSPIPMPNHILEPILTKPTPKPTYFPNSTNGTNTDASTTSVVSTDISSNTNPSYLHSNRSVPLLKSIRNQPPNHVNSYPYSNTYNKAIQKDFFPDKIGGTNSDNNNYRSKRFPLYSHSNSTTAIPFNKVPLTASQRYRLRKEQNETSLRKSIKKKERFYEDQEQVMELQEGDIDDTLIWNIPTASFSTSSFLNSTKPSGLKLGQSTKAILQQHKNPIIPKNGPFVPGLDFFDMPTSPIPGISKVTDFQYIQDTTKKLSNIYINSSEKLSKSKLSERANSACYLPLDLKEASEKGMEDLLLISENKLELMSNSRPSWLPPKDPEEKKAHEEQISKSISMASIEQLDRNKDREQRLIRNETNRQKFVLLLDRDVTRKSSIKTLQKIIWETSFSDDVRLQMYNTILQSDVKLITKKYIDPFANLLEIVNGMDFPKGKEVELEQLINKSITSKRNNSEMISKDLILMLKIKSISTQGLLVGDELLFYHFLQNKSFKTLSEVWETVNLIQMTCFNDLCQEKYDSKIISKKGIVANYLLRNDDFKDEFNSTCLNFNTWWNILERVDHALFMWIMDIIVVHNAQCFKNDPVKGTLFHNQDWDFYKSKKVFINYKILLSFVLNILLNYHFGFIDLKVLADLDNKDFCIPIPMDDLIDKESVDGLFIRKWLHYYKKF